MRNFSLYRHKNLFLYRKDRIKAEPQTLISLKIFISNVYETKFSIKRFKIDWNHYKNNHQYICIFFITSATWFLLAFFLFSSHVEEHFICFYSVELIKLTWRDDFLVFLSRLKHEKIEDVKHLNFPFFFFVFWSKRKVLLVLSLSLSLSLSRSLSLSLSFSLQPILLPPWTLLIWSFALSLLDFEFRDFGHGAIVSIYVHIYTYTNCWLINIVRLIILLRLKSDYYRCAPPTAIIIIIDMLLSLVLPLLL